MNYGVWDFKNRCFEDNADLDYNNAMGLALLCVDIENDFKRFAVIAMNQNNNPIWHDMPWCGHFHGYEWLKDHCIEIGQVQKNKHTK
tara:strand:- start:56 stop:316 length:261 start_codon:yes stop_codon:yes gene_type:complete